MAFKHILCNHAGTSIVWKTRGAFLSLSSCCTHWCAQWVQHFSVSNFECNSDKLVKNVTKSKSSLRLFRVAPRCVTIALQLQECPNHKKDQWFKTKIVSRARQAGRLMSLHTSAGPVCQPVRQPLYYLTPDHHIISSARCLSLNEGNITGAWL